MDNLSSSGATIPAPGTGRAARIASPCRAAKYQSPISANTGGDPAISASVIVAVIGAPTAPRRRIIRRRRIVSRGGWVVAVRVVIRVIVGVCQDGAERESS